MRMLALLLLTGCEMLATSNETATRDMRLYVTIESSDELAGTHVDATLSGPFGDPDLGPNDSFTLDVEGAPTPLVAVGAGHWTADLAARGGELAFLLHHANDHDVKSVANLPAPSGIHAASSGGKLIIDWTEAIVSDATTTLTVKGWCIEPQSIAIRTDTGHYELVGAQLQPLPASCPVTLGLERDVEVTTAPFGEAFMDAHVTQSETAEATWTP